LIWVDSGASSGQLKAMPNASQLMQTTLKPGFGFGICEGCAAFELGIGELGIGLLRTKKEKRES
jgi:hypothetical protein